MGMQTPRGGIDFAVLSEGFELVSKNWVTYTVFSLLMLVANYAVSMIISLPFTIGNAINPPGPGDDMVAFFVQQQLQSIPLTILTTVIGGVVTGLMMGGIAIVSLKLLRGEKAELGDAFNAFSMFAPLAVAGIVYNLSVTIGFYLCCIPGLIVGGLLMPLFPIIVNERLGLKDALSKSLTLTKNHLAMAAVFFLVQGIVAVLGVIACCVGFLFTYPVALACNTLIYRDLGGPVLGTPASPTNYPRSNDPGTPGSMPEYTDPE